MRVSAVTAFASAASLRGPPDLVHPVTGAMAMANTDYETINYRNSHAYFRAVGLGLRLVPRLGGPAEIHDGALFFDASESQTAQARLDAITGALNQWLAASGPASLERSVG